MDLSDLFNFFEWMPRIALAGLALIIALTVWMIWRNVSPAAQGISLGYYEILGRYAGKKLLRRIRGTLVEATALFLNPEIEHDFKEMILEDIDVLIERGQNPNQDADLQFARDQFKNYSLSDVCRIVVTRERFFSKQVIIQYGQVSKPLNAYAAHDPSSKFTLGMGFLCQGVISGLIYTFPQQWEIYRLGKVTVHLFLPDAQQEEREGNPPEWLAKIAMFAPASVELKDLVKSKDEQLQEKDRKLSEMGRELSAMATERDALRRAIKGFSATGEIPDLVPKRFDIMDFIAVSIPTLVGFYVAEYSKFQPVIGVVFGLLFGAFLLYKRR